MSLSGLSGLSGLSAQIGGGFTPASISGLVADWNPAALSLNDGDAADTLPDTYAGKTGTSSGAARATYKTNIFGSKPALLFSGAQAYSVPSIDLSAATGITFCCVCKITTASVALVYEFSTNYNSFSDSFDLETDASGKYLANMRGGLYSTFTTNLGYTSTSVLLSAVYDKALSTNEVTLYEGGFANGTRGFNNNNTGTFGNRTSFFGARNAASAFFTGYIGRAILYNRALSTTERQQVEAYLA